MGKKNIVKYLAVLFLISLSLMLGWHYGRNDLQIQGRIAQSFDLESPLTKDRKRFEDWKGSSIIVHFWASWCAPCLEELPRIVEASHANPDRKWVAITVDENWDDAERVLKGIISLPLKQNFWILWDPRHKISDQYGTYSFPETYQIGKKGQILKKWIGFQDWSSVEFSDES